MHIWSFTKLPFFIFVCLLLMISLACPNSLLLVKFSIVKLYLELCVVVEFLPLNDPSLDGRHFYTLQRSYLTANDEGSIFQSDVVIMTPKYGNSLCYDCVNDFLSYTIIRACKIKSMLFSNKIHFNVTCKYEIIY